MSKSILKRFLQLVEDDLPQNSSKTPKQARQNVKNKQKNGSIFDLIPEQKRLTMVTKAGKNKVKRKFIKTTRVN